MTQNIKKGLVGLLLGGIWLWMMFDLNGDERATWRDVFVVALAMVTGWFVAEAFKYAWRKHKETGRWS
jgi:hypothetical protein